MKRLAMVLAVAFTMGLAASTVSASTKDDTKKAKTETTKECCSKDKKSCSSGSAEQKTEKK